MEEAPVTATFSPVAGDRTTLAKASQATIAAIYQHPLSHNLEWSEVVALFEKLGGVDEKSNDKTAFSIGGYQFEVPKSHTKDLTTADIMAFRHMLSKSGWSPQTAKASDIAVDTSDADAAGLSARLDLLVVMEHHEARVYQLDIGSADSADHVIRPYDPHHFLHHLSHKDQLRERGQRTPEDQTFYERVAKAVSVGDRIVLIGHGKGHSNAAHHLADHLRLHHADIFEKMACELVADLSSLTSPQLLDLGRRSLSVGIPRT